MLGEPTKLKFKIVNIGEIAFDYAWNLNSHLVPTTYRLDTEESEGTVDKNSEYPCSLEIIATDKVVINNHPITLKVYVHINLHIIICTMNPSH